MLLGPYGTTCESDGMSTSLKTVTRVMDEMFVLWHWQTHCQRCQLTWQMHRLSLFII